MDLKGKNIAVFGMGLSGLWSVKLLNQKGAVVKAVNKGEPRSWNNYGEISNLIGEDHCFSEEKGSEVFSKSDLIILSPGIPRYHDVLKQALDNGVEVISEIELGYYFLKDEKIIAVTGSNGKTTTVSMLGEMLKASGKSVFVGGNIGNPLAKYIYDDNKCEFIVLELSSFQLESMPKFRAHSNIYLNIFKNHMERYDSLEDYARAKFNLGNNLLANDLMVYPSNFKLITDWVDTLNVQKISIDSSDIDSIKKEIEKDYSLEKFKLAGTHNISNLLFMLKALTPFNISKEGIQKAIDSFPGVDYRIQYEESDDSFTIYNDAKSTNWDATLTAINSLPKNGKELWVIIGGRKREESDSIIPQIENLKQNVDKILLIGETADQFFTELSGKIEAVNLGTIQDVIKYTRENKFDGILLFSPAFPSFDQFKNYIDRGESFHRLFGM